MTDPDLTNSATPHQLEPELVSWFMRFRGTARAAHLASQHPEEVDEANRLLHVTRGYPLSREEVLERWENKTPTPTTGERFRFADGKEVSDRLQAKARAAFADLPEPTDPRRPRFPACVEASLTRIETALRDAGAAERARRAAVLAEPVQAVEIRRPAKATEERWQHRVAQVLAIATTIALVRYSARLFGVELTRKQAFLLAWTLRATTGRGSGYLHWTRETPRAPK